ncbi:MAG TPA: ATP-binding cassette domain-containing protein [Myxococcaceae bacterium]|nr:ATP-binding cassette domain-containing protein [Myxococcaceae bacterium]
MLELELEVVRDGFTLEVQLSLARGPTALVGPNGAGKSTLLRAILGAVPVRRGRIVLERRTLLDTSRGLSLPTEERRVAWVPQEYALFPHLSVLENITFGTPGRAGLAHAGVVMDQLGLGPLASRKPGALSGGERQKVALARALAAEPRALLLDEPLAALDADTREATRVLLADTLRRLAIPSLVVTHEIRDVLALAGPVVLLEAGRIRSAGALDVFRASPPSEFARSLVTPRAGGV